MTPEFNFDAWATKLAGVAGALVSMRFLSGPVWERGISVIGGSAASYYLTPWLAQRLSSPEGLTGFLVGMLSMAVFSRLMEFVQETPISAIWAIVIGWIPRKKG